ncbi:MAG: amino acid permease [Firmicutes bacterium]|nr:amino acid permease [Bacillota bacterium]
MNKNQGQLVRGITLTTAIALVSGSVIGSGIFISPSLMAGYIQSPGIIMLLFIIGGLFTLFGALSYGELAAAMPRAGGQYVFLREAFSPLIGFIYGWSLFLVIQTGTIAAVAIAFAKYLGVLIPSISEKAILLSVPVGNGAFTLNAAQVVGAVSILILTIINCNGIKLGSLVQNVFTFLKILAIVILVAAAFVLSKGSTANFQPLTTPVIPETIKLGLFAALAVAMSKALFAYEAWHTVTFTAEEIENPKKNLPLALLWGTLIITAVYTAATAAYFYLIPVKDAALVADNRIAAAAAKIVFGEGGLIFIALAIMISTFGCNNGLIFSGARVYYAMARDGLFFKSLGKLCHVHNTPNNALVWQGIMAALLTLSGTYSSLLTYTTFASVLFNILTVVGLFILRRKMPELERPYKVWGYPVVPALFIIIGSAFLFFVVQGDPVNSLVGLGIVLLGLPLYFIFGKGMKKEDGAETDEAYQASV